MVEIPAKLYPQSDQDKYLHVAHKDRWECLKPVIIDLYLGPYGTGNKTMTLDQVVEFMKTNYSFRAAATEYRPRLRTWGISKRVTKDMKDGAIDALGKRKRPATSTSQVIVARQGRDQQLHPHKLMRHLKEQRRRRSIPSVMPGLFSSWELLYKAFVASNSRDEGSPSSFKLLVTTPECLNIKSPTPLTPGREPDPPSPNMQLIYQKAKEERARLFLEGRLDDLIGGMSREDRKLFVNYFYNFYMTGLLMAKNWGQKLSDGATVIDAVTSPQSWRIDTPSYHPVPTLSPSVRKSPERQPVPKAPTQLCNWSIHVPSPKDDAKCIYYSATEQSQHQVQQVQPTTPSILDELRQSISSSSFTSLPLQDLPFAQDVIVDAIKNDQRALDIDAWKLAIMAGNIELLDDLFQNNEENIPNGIQDIHPFHLAASFINGGYGCCEVLEKLVSLSGSDYPFHHNIDSHGHTILDALMVSILRSHTKVDPASVSYAFHSPNRFPGEEMDICGRWGPDTRSVRELFQQGVFRIPHSWKHPFCHTAVQAICHAIIVIYTPLCAPRINKTSGLFIRRCTECGKELRLGPLHTLVVITFYLAQSGMEGENLFGAIAVLVCLLSLGADVTITANISVEEILGTSETVQCRHIDLSPMELMDRVPKEVIDAWADDCKVGWSCFAQILSHTTKHRHSQADNIDSNDDRGDQFEEDHDDTRAMSVSDASSENVLCDLSQYYDKVHEYWLNLKCHDADMGLLWATIQTELVTYRRINEGDSWISENFSLRALRAWLSGESVEFATPLVKDRMMQAHSKCGWFYDAECFVTPAAQEVSANYFMNMDIYKRATYIGTPELMEWWRDVEPLDEEDSLDEECT
ncbi:hypothetical protein F5Y09DRAFT_264042 [Xylaria sp. FL1042]|nr:hypothetical protein F5Y09DRAFT_264042 [Xylaria sp. FL1042]